MSSESQQAKTQRKKELLQQRISVAQREIMLQFMVDHPALATGRLTTQNGAEKKQRLAEEMTTLLNCCSTGTTKSGDKWMKSWQDWRSDVKQKVAKIRAATGSGQTCSIQLTPLEERLLAFLESESVSGHASIDPMEVQVVGASRGQPTAEPVPNSDDCSELTQLVTLHSNTVPAVSPASPSNSSLDSHSNTTPLQMAAPAMQSSSSGRKRRRTYTKSSKPDSHIDMALLKVFEEKNELAKIKIALEKERVEIDKRRLEMQREHSKVICNAVNNASMSFCAAMQTVVQYFTSQRPPQ